MSPEGDWERSRRYKGRFLAFTVSVPMTIGSSTAPRYAVDSTHAPAARPVPDPAGYAVPVERGGRGRGGHAAYGRDARRDGAAILPRHRLPRTRGRRHGPRRTALRAGARLLRRRLQHLHRLRACAAAAGPARG